MKKIILVFAALLLVINVTACKKVEQDPNLPNIGIAKLISHNSLNEAENGIRDELEAQGIRANIQIQDANNDLSTINQIANKFKSDKLDVAVGIATPVTVSLFNTLENTPIVFTAVTDPVAAGFAVSSTQGKKNITGVTDAIPIKEQLMEFKKIYDFKRLGVIYTSSEPNSVSMVKTTQKACDELGVKLVLQAINSPSELKQATEGLANRVDAFYCFTDNSIATAMASLTDMAKQYHKPVFGGDITPTLHGGVVYALGFSYYEMGRMTGQLIVDILNGKSTDELPILTLTDKKYYNKLIDLDTAKYLGIKIDDALIQEAKYIIKDQKLTVKE